MKIDILKKNIKDTTNDRFEIHTLKWDSGRTSGLPESAILVLKPIAGVPAEEAATVWAECESALLEHTRANFFDIAPEHVSIRLKGENE